MVLDLQEDITSPRWRTIRRLLNRRNGNCLASDCAIDVGRPLLGRSLAVRAGMTRSGIARLGSRGPLQDCLTDLGRSRALRGRRLPIRSGHL